MTVPHPRQSRPAAKVRVHLTDHWQRFVPRTAANAEMLGVVERKMQIGALARLSEGSYVQVNGDVLQPLNATQVNQALRAAENALRRERAAVHPHVPTIVVKRRRTAVAVR